MIRAARIVLCAAMAMSLPACWERNRYQSERCYPPSDAGAQACLPREDAAPRLVAAGPCDDPIVSVDEGPVRARDAGGPSGAPGSCCYLVTLDPGPGVCME